MDGGAESHAELLGRALAGLHGPDPAQMLPLFRTLAQEIGELPQDGEWGPLLRGLVYNGGFGAAYAANRFEEARQFAEAECEALRLQPGAEGSYARALNNRGLAQLELGHLVSAEQDFRAALDLLRDPGVRAGMANAGALIQTVDHHLLILAQQRRSAARGGVIRGGEADPDLAVSTIAGLEPPAQRHARSANSALARADDARRRGHRDEAVRIIADVVEAARVAGDKRALGIALSNLGDFRLEHDAPAALAALSEAVSVLATLPRPNGALALAEHNLSLALERSGDMPAATEAAKRAWLLIEEASPTGPDALAILHNLAKLRLVEKDLPRARAILEHALSLYDDRRADFAVTEADHQGTFGLYRSLLELMLLISVHERWIDEAELLIEKAKGRFLAEHLERMLPKPSEPAQAGEASPIADGRDDAEIDFASQLAVSGTCLVSVFTGPNMTFVAWKVGKAGGVYRLDIAETDLRAQVELFFADLQSASRAQPWRASGRQLDALLFGSIAEHIRASTAILFLPDGPLWQLPLDALMLAAADGSQDRQRIATYSAFTLRSIEQVRRLEPARPAPGARALIIAKSEFQSQPAIDDVIRESRAIALRLERSGLAPRMLSDRDATAAAVLAALGDAEIIHLATHVVAPIDGTSPYVIVDDGGGGEARLLVEDIVGLKLSARLVYLSVCDSGAGAASAGEGIVSIARAFVLAGCHSVVATLWPVVSHDAAFLAERFYEAYGQGNAPADALRIAKDGWQDGGSFMRTAAAFQVYGDAGMRLGLKDLAESLRRQLRDET